MNITYKGGGSDGFAGGGGGNVSPGNRGSPPGRSPARFSYVHSGRIRGIIKPKHVIPYQSALPEVQ